MSTSWPIARHSATVRASVRTTPLICGHIHKAEIRQIAGVTYMNDGDWVESCTALVEHFDGRFEILEWAKLRSWSMIRDARAATIPEAEGELPEPLIA